MAVCHLKNKLTARVYINITADFKSNYNRASVCVRVRVHVHMHACVCASLFHNLFSIKLISPYHKNILL